MVSRRSSAIPVDSEAYCKWLERCVKACLGKTGEHSGRHWALAKREFETIRTDIARVQSETTTVQHSTDELRTEVAQVANCLSIANVRVNLSVDAFDDRFERCGPAMSVNHGREMANMSADLEANLQETTDNLANSEKVPEQDSLAMDETQSLKD